MNFQGDLDNVIEDFRISARDPLSRHEPFPCPMHKAPGPGGGTPLYKVYRYVPPQRVWFLSRFGLKTGIDFDSYGLKSSRVFGAGNIYESLPTYFSSQYVTGTTNG